MAVRAQHVLHLGDEHVLARFDPYPSRDRALSGTHPHRASVAVRNQPSGVNASSVGSRLTANGYITDHDRIWSLPHCFAVQQVPRCRPHHHLHLRYPSAAPRSQRGRSINAGARMIFRLLPAPARLSSHGGTGGELVVMAHG